MPNVSSLSPLTLQNQPLNWKWNGLYYKINKSLYFLRVRLKGFYKQSKQDYNHFTACDSKTEKWPDHSWSRKIWEQSQNLLATRRVKICKDSSTNKKIIVIKNPTATVYSLKYVLVNNFCRLALQFNILQ